MSDDETESFGRSVIDEFECPVCLLHMIEPIFQCTSGHEVCSKCFVKLETCPICRVEKDISKISRARTLENIASYTTFPCKYKNVGCDFAANGASIRQHEISCAHPTYICPLSPCKKISCKWSGKRHEVKLHYEREHCNYLNYGDLAEGRISLDIKNISPNGFKVYMAGVINLWNNCLFKIFICIMQKEDCPVLCGAFYYGSERDGTSHIVTISLGPWKRERTIEVRPKPAIDGNFVINDEAIHQLSYFCNVRELHRLCRSNGDIRLGIEVSYEGMNELSTRFGAL